MSSGHRCSFAGSDKENLYLPVLSFSKHDYDYDYDYTFVILCDYDYDYDCTKMCNRLQS